MHTRQAEMTAPPDEVGNNQTTEPEHTAEGGAGSTKVRRKKKVPHVESARIKMCRPTRQRTSALAATETHLSTPCTPSEEVCQTLLRECMNGNYESLPDFATTVWDWFVQTEASCPRESAFLVGQKAMKLLSCIDVDAFVEETSREGVGGTSGSSCITLVLAGMCAREPYVWSAAAAFVACRVAHAWRLHAWLQRPFLVCGGSVLMLATVAAADSVSLGVFHASVWYLVTCWQCGFKWNGRPR